jgi:ABC-type dipeptide/oligopeptide/nickel transport system permease component
MGLTLILAILILIANLITDVVYAFVDPRIRYD